MSDETPKSESAPATAESSLEIDASIKIEEGSLSRMLDWVRSSNTKVTPMLAISLAMLGVPAGLVKEWSPIVAFPLVIASLGPAMCLVFCWRATFPQTKSVNKSLLFFGTVAEMSLDDYRSQVRARSKPSYLEDLMCQTHRNAEIAHDKHNKLKWAMQSLFIGILPWLLSIYFLLNLPHLVKLPASKEAIPPASIVPQSASPTPSTPSAGGK
jgi:hypothetical protein